MSPEVDDDLELGRLGKSKSSAPAMPDSDEEDLDGDEKDAELANGAKQVWYMPT